MENKTPIVNIKPDVVYMPPENFEAPGLKIVIAPDPIIKFCPHDQIKIFPHHRLIQCNNCGITLDPFDYLLDVGKKEGNQLSNIVYLNHRAKQLTEEVDRLQKEIKYLKKQKSKYD